MEQGNEKYAKLVKDLEEFGKTQLELTKYKLDDKFSSVLSVVICQFILYVFLFLCVTFFSVAASLWLGAIIGEAFLGFVILSFTFLFVFLLIFAFQKMISKRLKDIIINHLI